MGRRHNDPGHTWAEYLRFISLIEQLLSHDKLTRATPLLALRHPFFTPTRDAATMTDPALVGPRRKSTGASDMDATSSSRAVLSEDTTDVAMDDAPESDLLRHAHVQATSDDDGED